MSNTSEDIVANVLMKKRAELLAQIEHHQNELGRLLADIDTVDASIRIFAPHIVVETIAPKMLPPRHAAARGEITMLVLSILRDAPDPIRTEEINRLVMEARNLNTADKELTKMMLQRIHSCLRNHRKHGRVRSVKNAEENCSMWEVV